MDRHVGTADAAAEGERTAHLPVRVCELHDDLLRDIRILWMMTPRDDLPSRSPRQIMTVGQRFVSSSMQDRETQWSLTGQCPPGLDPDSAAYRLGAFGIHEAVVYYDLVRELLWRCRENVAKRARSCGFLHLTERIGSQLGKDYAREGGGVTRPKAVPG